MKNRVKKNNIENIERLIFWCSLCLLVFSSVTYGFFVNQTIVNIVERENMEEKITMLNSEISSLEFEFISLKNEIDINYAYSLGFVNVEDMKFASRKLPVQNLSLKSN